MLDMKIDLQELTTLTNNELIKLVLDLSSYQDDHRIQGELLMDLIHQYSALESLLKERIADVERLSITDTLTQLKNRLYLNGALSRTFERYKRYGTPFSVLLFDIDYFKKVNDSYGHDVGDEVLKEIAHLALHHSRTTDVVARWGGEEFIVLMENTHIAEAYHYAERLRGAIESTDFKIGRPVTISGGLAEISELITTDMLVKAADRALYKAKQNGRNHIY